MSFDIYDMSAIDSFGYADKIPDGWRVFRINTGNVCDECYIDMPADMDEDEREDEIRFALRRKFGRGYGFRGIEDVTELYRED